MAKEKKPDTDKAKAEVAEAQKQSPLKVEVHFPAIADLKQAIAFDADNNLVMAIQFKVKVDQFETFRLLNLLKQPHGTLYATLGSPQSAMDFNFTKDGKVEIIKAQIVAEKAADKKKALPAAQDITLSPGASATKISDVTFNHVPDDPKPFGVFISYAVNGSDEAKSCAGRGDNPTEAVIAGVIACGVVGEDVNEPFEIRAALEALETSPAAYKLIRVIDVGNFDTEKEG